VNIYDLLFIFVKTHAKMGGMSKVDAYDSLELINKLREVSAFGTMGSITTGHHKYMASKINNLCLICDKTEDNHE
jgi:hypothetical protein